MNATDRQRLQIWAMLVIVLGLALWAGQRIFDFPADLAVTTDRGDPNQVSDRRDLESVKVLSRWQSLDLEGGILDGPRRNPFEYGPEPPAELPVQSLVSQAAPSTPPPPIQPPSAPPPPPPPPIPFRYSGWSRIGGDDGELEAWLFDDGEAYSVVEQEVVMGRYRINQITDQFVEIEDLEFDRRQRLPLLVQ